MNGALLINKEAGITSFDVLRHLKIATSSSHACGKIGHSGTLDPFATGLLIILVGHATRLQEELHILPKTYRAEITLGANTDTDDVTGTISPPRMRGSEIEPSQQQILAALDHIKAQKSQIPPDYAAIKIQGQKMYDLARAGKTIVKKARPITIHEIKLENYIYPQLEISVTCSTGTYIRSIARDLGEILGTGAYCSGLERTAIGPFTVQNSHLLKDLPKDLKTVIIPLEQLVSHIQSVEFSANNVAKLKNGREVEGAKNTPTNTPIALLDNNKKLFGIGIQNIEGSIKSRKIFLR